MTIIIQGVLYIGTFNLETKLTNNTVFGGEQFSLISYPKSIGCQIIQGCFFSPTLSKRKLEEK
jgi:hypothetical protein